MTRSTDLIDEYPDVEDDDDLLELAAEELDGRAGEIAAVALQAGAGVSEHVE